jgi:hypothetical protein
MSVFAGFAGAPSFCDNKFCPNHGSVPTTGNLPPFQCGTYQTMERERITTGGITGRGVTPCPLGYFQNANDNTVSPFKGRSFDIYFEPNRATFLPPQGEPRSLRRVGDEWRNN